MNHKTPDNMTAVEISAPGGPEVLKTVSRPVPTPDHGQVLVKVAAAGVNRPDVIQRQGLYPPPPGASDLPGLEIAGIVVGIGAGVTGLALGNEICALVSGGGYAEYCLVDAALALPLPRGASMVEAAALPETFFTVWTNVFDRGRLAAGETFLVHGGTSGIGTTAIQLAQAFGARVFATAGSAEKCEAAENLGAEKAFNYNTEDFVALTQDLTEGRGLDVILDMVGGDYVQRNLAALAMEGRLVNIAFLGGAQVELNLFPLMLKRLTMTGSTLRPQSLEAKASIAAALRAKVWPLLDEGRIAPVIDSTFALSDAPGAHALMETSTHIGKIVLEVGDQEAK